MSDLQQGGPREGSSDPGPNSVTGAGKPPTLRERLTLKAMSLARRLGAGTAIEGWRVTAIVQRWTFRQAFKADEVQAQFRGRTVIVPTTDLAMTPGILAGYYEKLALDAFEALARDASLIVDVGANIGIYTIVAATVLSDGGNVVAFEPAPENLELLARNVSANGVEARVSVEPVAVDRQAGTMTLYMDRSAPGQHSAAPRSDESAAHPHVVVATTLDAALAGRGTVDVVKIDVEGAEAFVLEGARATLQRDRPALLIEYFPAMLTACGADPESVVREIFDLYDDVYDIDEKSQRLVPVERGDLRPGVCGDRLNLLAVQRAEHRSRLRSLLEHT